MKTLVKDTVSIMILPDDFPIEMGETIVIGRYRIGNKHNDHTLYENVTPPQDYKGKRWCFDGVDWTVNTNWRGEKLRNSIKR
jgi:hypothetical protein